VSALRNLICLSILTLLFWAPESPAQQDAPAALDLPIQRIVLFDTGVGFFEHRGVADGNAEVALEFNVDDVNDLLKSMVVQDEGGGQINAVNYGAKDPAEAQLNAFSVDLTTAPTLAELLQQLRGEQVQIERPTKLQGTIMGLEIRSQGTGDAPSTDKEYLNLLTDEGLQSVALDSVTRLQLVDQRLRQELQQALEVLAESRRADKRPVTLQFRGEGRRPIRVGYIRQTPVWKTSYRLVLGDDPTKALLQAWAIVENTGENDWQDVRLTLVSGRPVSFIMELYEPLFVQRPNVAPPVAGSPKPRVYAPAVVDLPPAMPGMSGMGGMGGMGMGGGAFGGMGGMGGGMGGYFGGGEQPGYEDEEAWDPSQGVVSQAGGEEVGEMFQYELESPVTLARRKSAMLPIINDPIEVEKLSVYTAGDNQSRPMHALRLTNREDKHLTAGPITVFEDAAYAGDARISHVSPGEQRLISYALDQEISVTREDVLSPPSHITTANIKDGQLTIERTEQTMHGYGIANQGTKPRKLMIEHPLPGDPWKVVRPEEPTEETETHLRYEITVPAEKSQKLEVVHQRDWTETRVMADLQVANIREFLADSEVPESVKQTLSKLGELLDERQRLQGSLSIANGGIKTIEQEQKRIKSNMTDLDRTNELYQRYLKMLETSEDDLAKAREAVRAIEQQIEETNGRLEQIAPRHAPDPFPADSPPAPGGGDPFGS